MAAEVEYAGRSFSPSHPLAELPAQRIPPILRRPIEQGYDVAWVRARFPLAFGFLPNPSEMEKTLLWQSFVAIPPDLSEGVAFDCADAYGQTALWYSDDEDDEALKQQAACAFWGALLAEPELLEDFEASVEHLGTPITLHFGCANGEPFMHETTD